MMPSCNRSCSCSRGPSVEDGKWYGVRSYLHLFYEDCAGTALSDDPEGPPVLCPRRPWPSLCWKEMELNFSPLECGLDSATCF
ncbi:NRSN2 isoform 8 [Pan troglodytes]|uniref:Neurensin 2 n=5 Tax=Homininae TaxID=207598 RepID=V9GYY0_HUMAN|nr:neurensin 2 [Homo sapiens]KAI4004433.1 neurensin 2 [Homo sapiens]PNI62252.1 NRSN2 isoform 8 [Pan troglodytes]